MLDGEVPDQMVELQLLRAPCEPHQLLLGARSLEQPVGREAVAVAVELHVAVAEDLRGDLGGDDDEEVQAPPPAPGAPEPIERADRLFRRRQLGPQLAQLLRQRPDAWLQLGPPALAEPERGGAEGRRIVLPLGLELRLVGPAELGAGAKAAERAAQLAHRLVQAEPECLEPDRRRQRRQLLGVMRRVRQPDRHSVVIGLHWTSQSVLPSKQNSTSTGRRKPRSASRTSAATARASSSRSTRSSPAARARTVSPTQ